MAVVRLEEKTFVPASINRLKNDIATGETTLEEAQAEALEMLEDLINYTNPGVVIDFATQVFDLEVMQIFNNQLKK